MSTLTIGRIGSGDKVHAARNYNGLLRARCNGRNSGTVNVIAAGEVSSPAEVAALLVSHHVPAANLCTKCFGEAVITEMGA